MIDSTEGVAGARIKVIGIGGGGGNAINTMIVGGLPGVDFLVANTDRQALFANLSPLKLQLGEQLTGPAIHAVDVALLGVPAIADSGVDEHPPPVALGQQAAQGHPDAVAIVGRQPFLPHGFGHDAEGGATIQPEESIAEGLERPVAELHVLLIHRGR